MIVVQRTLGVIEIILPKSIGCHISQCTMKLGLAGRGGLGATILANITMTELTLALEQGHPGESSNGTTLIRKTHVSSAPSIGGLHHPYSWSEAA
jgi:hypothetical protein